MAEVFRENQKAFSEDPSILKKMIFFPMSIIHASFFGLVRLLFSPFDFLSRFYQGELESVSEMASQIEGAQTLNTNLGLMFSAIFIGPLAVIVLSLLTTAHKFLYLVVEVYLNRQGLWPDDFDNFMDYCRTN